MAKKLRHVELNLRATAVVETGATNGLWNICPLFWVTGLLKPQQRAKPVKPIWRLDRIKK